jgi:hypothetical protein
MKRVILLSVAAAGAFAGCAQALAAVTAQANVSLDVQQAAGVNIVTPLVLPTVSTTAVVPSSSFTPTTAPVVASSSASGGGLAPTSSGFAPTSGGLTTTTGATASATPLGNATLTIYGQSGSAVSMAVPETFKVIRTGGTESLTVKTNTNSPYSLAGNGVVLGGAPGSESMSVNVGGALTMASADQLVPGPYEGLLVVVVQYN